MPIALKRVKRPWELKRDKNTPGQGRTFVTGFYKKPAWRNLRKAFIGSRSEHQGTEAPHPNSICIDCYRNGEGVVNHALLTIKK